MLNAVQFYHVFGLFWEKLPAIQQFFLLEGQFSCIQMDCRNDTLLDMIEAIGL